MKEIILINVAPASTTLHYSAQQSTERLKVMPFKLVQLRNVPHNRVSRGLRVLRIDALNLHP